MKERAWTVEEFQRELSSLSRFYYGKHPFHQAMHRGELTVRDLGTWAANVYYYETILPRKDAAILSNCSSQDVRRQWVKRVRYQDGGTGAEGAIEGWARLCQSLGVERGDLAREQHVTARVREICGKYLDFCRNAHWIIGVASTLSDLFAPDLLAERLHAFERHYSFVDPEALRHFKDSIRHSEANAVEALEIVITHCITLELEKEAVKAIAFQCAVLWEMLDAIQEACAAEEESGGSFDYRENEARVYARD